MNLPQPMLVLSVINTTHGPFMISCISSALVWHVHWTAAAHSCQPKDGQNDCLDNRKS
jgi:hypothetical protein